MACAVFDAVNYMFSQQNGDIRENKTRAHYSRMQSKLDQVNKVAITDDRYVFALWSGETDPAPILNCNPVIYWRLITFLP